MNKHQARYQMNVSDFYHARPIGFDEMIYTKEIFDAISLIWKITQEPDETPDEPMRNSVFEVVSRFRRHLNIGILGNRGSGKTSILLTLLDMLQGYTGDKKDIEKYNNFDENFGMKSKLSKLNEETIVGGLLEPSRMESDSRIVTEIFTRMIEILSKSIDRSPDTRRRWEEKKEKLDMCSKAVHSNLSTILNVDRIRQAYLDQGEQGVQDEILSRRSGGRLEKVLWTFTEIFLEILGKKFIVFGLDDVDMSCDRAFEVLESLRLYMTHKNLIILLTGDEKLFNIVLFEEFRKKLWKNQDSETEDLIVNIVTQYLQKVLSPGLRVNLSPLPKREILKIEIKTKSANVPFNTMFNTAICVCLSRKNISAQKQEDYYCLIPDDIRRLAIFNKLVFDVNETYNPDIPKDPQEFILKLAQLWRPTLEKYNLSPELIDDWMQEERLGIKLLNYYVENDYLQEYLLEIDQKLVNRAVSVVICFIRFLIERYINQKEGSSDRILSFALDYTIPTYYLRRLQVEDRKLFAREYQLELRDSHRRLYSRLASIVTNKSKIHPGMVRINNRDGALEKLLDVYNGSADAQWRELYPNPGRRDFIGARREAVNHCQEYFSEINQGTSAYQWAISYLPTVFKTGKSNLDLEKHPRLLISPTSGSQHDACIYPLPSEMICSPSMFSTLSGALPYLVFKAWTSKEGSNYILNVWQILALMKRIIGDVFIKNDGKKINKNKLCDIVEHSLNRQIFGTDAVPPSKMQKSAEHIQEFDIQGDYHWKKFINKLRKKDSPLRFYPRLNKKNGEEKDALLKWPKPIPPIWTDEMLNEKLSDPDKPYVKEDYIKDYNDLEKFRHQAHIETLRWIAASVVEWLWKWRTALNVLKPDKSEIQSDIINYDVIQEIVNRFMKNREVEKDQFGIHNGIGNLIQRWVLDFSNSILLQTTTEPKWNLRSTRKLLRLISKPDIDSAQYYLNDDEYVHPLFQNLSMISEYNQKIYEETQTWSDRNMESGEILTEIKKLLTDEDYEEHVTEIQSLLDSEKTNSKDKMLEKFKNKCTYNIRTIFSIMISFPLFGMFIPLSSSMKKIAKNGNDLKPTDPRDENLSERAVLWNRHVKYDEKTMEQISSIYGIGDLMLIPLDSLRKKGTKPESDKQYLLDLAGLSWCGLDLRQPLQKPNDIEAQEHGENEPLNTVEERRTALIAMLNSMMPATESCEDAKALTPYLILAVDGAIHNIIDKDGKGNDSQ